MSDFIPNSYQTPNAYVDRFMHLLTAEEWKVLSYTARRIFGFRKVNHQDRISLSQYTDGVHTKDKKQLDYGTGLSKPAVMAALIKLKEYRLIIEVQPGNKAKNLAPLYELQLDSALVDLAGLEARAEQSRSRNLKKTTTARVKAAEKYAADTLVNGTDQVAPGQSDLPALVSRTDQHLVSPTDHPLVNGTDIQNTEGNKEKESGKRPRALSELAIAIADVCKINPTLAVPKQRQALNATYSALKAVGATPDDVRVRERWWYENDWRARNEKRPPRPAELQEIWEMATAVPVAQPKNGASKPDPHARPPLPMAKIERPKDALTPQEVAARMLAAREQGK